MWCFPQLCSDERQKIHWVAVSLQKPALAQSTSAVDESEIIFHLEKHGTETQGVIFGLCNLRVLKSSSCLLESTPLWSVLQISLENPQTPFTRYLHQHALGTPRLHSSTLNTCGLSRSPYLKSVIFPKERRLDGRYKFFYFHQSMW